MGGCRRVMSDLWVQLYSSTSEFRVGAERALEMFAAVMTGPGFASPSPTEATETWLALYDPILGDLVRGPEGPPEVERRIDGFAFGFAELTRIAAIAYTDPKALNTTPDEMASVVVAAFRDIYL